MSNHPPRTTELLSPAGDWEALRAAVANGADAVYFGLPRFNARQRAANFAADELPQVVQYLHRHNVRAYVAFNTLIYSDELAAAAGYAAAIAAAGADAVIVQDLGLAALIHRVAPSLPIHASTQMTLTESGGIEWVRRLGVRRVILARELSLAEIAQIAGRTDMELEVFVHGALCISVSGQCLASQSLFGRSGNRGQCGQACRLPYGLVVDGKAVDLGPKNFLLSPADLAAWDLVGKLVELGVSGLKIEGRLKNAIYVAAATAAYRKALDAALAGRAFALPAGDREALAQTFSRGWTHGYLGGTDHRKLVTGRFGRSRGVLIGTVAGVSPRGVLVELADGVGAESVKPGDGVVFDEGLDEEAEQGGRVFSVSPYSARAGRGNVGRRGEGGAFRDTASRTSEKGFRETASRDASRPVEEMPGRGPSRPVEPKSGRGASRIVELTFGRGAVRLNEVSVGAVVFKTDDPQLRRQLEATYSRDVMVRRVPIRVRAFASAGEKLRIVVSDDAGNQAEAISEQPLAAAIKHPLTAEQLGEPFGRLGDTPFELGGVELVVPPGGPAVMAPKSVLNELRRTAVAGLIEQREARARHAVVEPDALAAMRREAAGRGGNDDATDDVSRDIVGASPDNLGVPHLDPRFIGGKVCSGPAHLAPDKSGGKVWHPALEEREGVSAAARLHVLVRDLRQLEAVVGRADVATIYCDFRDPDDWAAAAERGRTGGRRIALATPRIIKPGEKVFVERIAVARPDAVLVRNLASLAALRELAPDLPLIGDFGLNVANELSADLLRAAGLCRITPAYELAARQIADLLAFVPPAWFEVVIHQHAPLFHTQHCLLAANQKRGHCSFPQAGGPAAPPSGQETSSVPVSSQDDCGRPCRRGEPGQLRLRDRVGAEHVILCDAGCRNTVFNAKAESAEHRLATLLKLGLFHFRVELLAERPDEIGPLLDRYAGMLGEA